MEFYYAISMLGLRSRLSGECGAHYQPATSAKFSLLSAEWDSLGKKMAKPKGKSAGTKKAEEAKKAAATKKAEEARKAKRKNCMTMDEGVHAIIEMY
jgi:hypothetical protein